MKKNAPRILAIVLLSLVAVLMIVAGSGSLIDVINEEEPTLGQGSNANLPTTDFDVDQSQDDSPSVDDTLIEENFFPIVPTSSTTHRFMQKLSLKKASLNASFSTTEGNFIVFSHSTTDGPFKVTLHSQSIAKFDSEGVIITARSIFPPVETEYLSSCMTVEGIVLALKSIDRTFVYTLSYDLTAIELIELPLFSDVELFSLTDGYLLFGKGKENVVYKIENNVVHATTVLQTGEIKGIYDFSEYFALFSSGINGYSYVKITTDLKIISLLSVPDRSLLAVEPIVENGQQKFLAIELTSSGVEIAKYNENFVLSEADRVGVGLAESADVFMNGESIFLLLRSSGNRIYLVDKDLSFTSSNNTTFQNLTELYDCFSTANGYNVLYAKSGILTFIDLRNDGTQRSINLETQTDNAFVCVSFNGAVAVAFSTGEGISIIGIN